MSDDRRDRGDSGDRETLAGTVVEFPDLDALVPRHEKDRRRNRWDRVAWRLVAFYDAIIGQLGRTDYPRPCGVYVNPLDLTRLQQWCEWPVRRESARARAGLSFFWFDKGPGESAHVPLGKVIITADAYPFLGPPSGSGDRP